MAGQNLIVLSALALTRYSPNYCIVINILCARIIITISAKYHRSDCCFMAF